MNIIEEIASIKLKTRTIIYDFTSFQANHKYSFKKI